MDNDLPDMQLVRSSGGLIRVLESVLDAFCAVLLVLMTCITTIDVVGRYVFHSPMQGAYESNEFLLAVLIFAAIPRVTWHHQHLSVTILDSFLSPAIRNIQQRCLSLISGAGLLILSYFLWLHGLQLNSYGDMSNALQIPIAPFAFFISIFTAIAALAALAHLFLPVRQP